MHKDHNAKHIWALTAILNFYVRLENHLALHYGKETIPAEDFLSTVGPFVFPFWADDIMAFVDACAIEHGLFSIDATGDERALRKAIRPYFIAPLRNLDARYKTAIAQMPAAKTSGQEGHDLKGPHRTTGNP